MIKPGYRERQDAQVAKQALAQIAYCEKYYKEQEMARGRKSATAKQAEELAEALKFVSVAGTKDNEHVRLQNKIAIMFDGQITAGHPIVEELDCCPHLDKLRFAINRCGKSLAITQLDANNRISVKGEKMRALVPCDDASLMWDSVPDTMIAAVDDRLKEAFKCVGVLADEKATEVIGASILLEANTATGTDRHVMMQYWHGIDLPPGLVIPKVFTNAVIKTDQKLTGFGYTPDRSITLWFENDAWLKTLLYADKWPDISHILSPASYPKGVADDFFKACEVVSKFAEDGEVYFCENMVQSHILQDVGSQYELPGLQAGKIFSGAQLKDIAPFVKSIDYTTFPDRMMFFNDNMRGCIMAIRKGSEHGQP